MLSSCNLDLNSIEHSSHINENISYILSRLDQPADDSDREGIQGQAALGPALSCRYWASIQVT